MGLRSLIEINHDRTIDGDPSSFVDAVNSYVRSGSAQHIDDLLSRYDIRVVALRHSSDNYYISRKTYGFPAKLPWDDFEKVRSENIAKARELTGGKKATKRDLEEMITSLVEIINRQQEVLDTD